MDNITEFDSAKYYLGKLCPHGHNWNETGKSLRYCKCRACVVCNKQRDTYNPERHKEWYQRNRGRLRDVRRRYRQENREYELERHQRYRLSNRERIRESNREYYRKNRDRINERIKRYQQTPQGKTTRRGVRVRRKARRLGNHVAAYTQEALQRHFERFGSCCVYCGTEHPLEADHFISISRGGPDCLSNIVRCL